MAACNIIVIGASAGGLSAIRDLVGSLDHTLRAAVFVVRHFPPTAESMLPALIGRCTELPIQHAEDGQPICLGRVYVAPPGYHLTLEAGAMRLAFAPRINGARPAIDPLFYSAARAFGRQVAGVLLSGYLDDGVGGLLAIHRAGGLSIVQDPEEAEVGDMPRSALGYFTPDKVLRAAEIGKALSNCATQEEVREEGVSMSRSSYEYRQSRPEGMSDHEPPVAGDEFHFSCPECGGAMQRVDAPGPPQFQCHIGHALTGESLLAEQFETLERSIWYASRTLKEIVVLARKLAERAREEDRLHAASAFEIQARSAERHLTRLQEDLLDQPLMRRAESAAEAG
jgi:two-component system chemotaxis response regulator CheB